MMLERLLELAGPETTVILCSDHGFESGSQRPHGTPREPAGPAVWHRQYGIFVMAGPGVKRDERIYGAVWRAVRIRRIRELPGASLR